MARTEAADLAFLGGRVLVCDEAGSSAEALAVRDGAIVAVGRRAEVVRQVGPATRVVELADGAVLPGINDSHLHAAMLGVYWPALWMESLAMGAFFPEARVLATEADRRQALRLAWDVLLPLGITSYTEPGLGPGADGQHGDSCGAAMLETYADLAEAGELPVRVNALLLFGELDGPSRPDDLARGLATLRLPATDPRWFRIAGVKIFADGIPPMRSAWLDEPYDDGTVGSLVVAGDGDEARLAALREMIACAHLAGHQIGVHATGSRTIAEVVAAFVSHDGEGESDHRHYLIHGDCAVATTLETMARSAIGLNAQPSLYTTTAQLLEGVIGRERTDRAFPLGTAVRAGVRVALSSDGPVIAPDWRRGVADAVLRRARDGSVHGEAQRLSVTEAIRGYTAHAAWQDRAETWKGTLEVGKVADLCVLAQDPLGIAPDELPGVQVTMTVVDGKVVFEQE